MVTAFFGGVIGCLAMLLVARIISVRRDNARVTEAMHRVGKVWGLEIKPGEDPVDFHRRLMRKASGEDHGGSGSQ